MVDAAYWGAIQVCLPLAIEWWAVWQTRFRGIPCFKWEIHDQQNVFFLHFKQTRLRPTRYPTSLTPSWVWGKDSKLQSPAHWFRDGDPKHLGCLIIGPAGPKILPKKCTVMLFVNSSACIELGWTWYFRRYLSSLRQNHRIGNFYIAIEIWASNQDTIARQ